jgi:protein TonB
MGGGVELFREWVQKNLVYSPIAVEKGIFGKIMVKFSIDETGKLYDAEIFKGVHPLLDNEALRVIRSSPLWEPATLNGKNVKQSIVMPVIFVLNKKQLKLLSQ